MQEKEIYLVNAKLQFINDNIEEVPFYVEAENGKQAETKLKQWLIEGNSNFKFADILFIEQMKTIQVIY